MELNNERIVQSRDLSQQKFQEVIQGPQWDLSTEYPSLTSSEFQADHKWVEDEITKLQTRVTAAFAVAPTQDAQVPNIELVHAMQGIGKHREEIGIVLGNLMTYVSCISSCDSSDQQAQKLGGALSSLYARLQQATTPYTIYLAQADEAFVEAYLANEQTKYDRFWVELSRKYRNTLLSESEEKLLAALATTGHHAWSTLYSQLSGNMKCHLKYEDGREETLGYSQTTGLLLGDDEPTRKAAWNAIQSAWYGQRESAAAILNALAGWRLEVVKKRSHTVKQNFLSQAIRMAKIEEETLNAMMTAVEEFLPKSREGLRFMAKGMGKDRLDPWDTLAGAPASAQPHALGLTAANSNGTSSSGKRPFSEGFDMIRSAFMEVDSEFGEFCDLMLKNQWIEGRVLETKRNGAYCTGFSKSRTPRVFQTYMGSLNDVRTLAHELGHAYHAWVQRDLPRAISGTPMTLAETASVFAETAFADYVRKHGSEHEKYEIQWQDCETAASFLINIPVRFEFEKSPLHRTRKGNGNPGRAFAVDERFMDEMVRRHCFWS
jgi:oligoendopeptidase F